MSMETLRMKSRLLLSIVKYLRLGHRHRDIITVSEINDAARRWSRQNRPSTKGRYVEQARASFETQAVKWLTFINRLAGQIPTGNSLRPLVGRLQKLYERR